MIKEFYCTEFVLIKSGKCKSVVMESLRTLNLFQLVDLLNKVSTSYYKMMKDRISMNEQVKCKLIINEIQKEINKHRKLSR